MIDEVDQRALDGLCDVAGRFYNGKAGKDEPPDTTEPYRPAEAARPATRRMLKRKDVAKLGSEAQTSAIRRGEHRLDEQCALATAQDGRIIMILSTAVSLAALAAVFAAGALSFPGHPLAVLAAALVALVGFTFVSGFALIAIRPGRFETSGSTPAEVVHYCDSENPETHRVVWICELDRRVTINETILEKRRRWLTWAAWTFMLTPPYALIIGWLASQLRFSSIN